MKLYQLRSLIVNFLSRRFAVNCYSVICGVWFFKPKSVGNECHSEYLKSTADTETGTPPVVSF